MSSARPLRVAALALAYAALGCATTPTVEDVPVLAHGRLVADFDSYTIHRVGVLPFADRTADPVAPGELQGLVQAELADATPWSLLALRPADLAEVGPIEPYRLGGYGPDELLELRRRYRLDAVLVGAVTARRVVAPQRLGLQLDLVSCETGATLWSAGVLLDAAEASTRAALADWSAAELGADEDEVDITLLSPHRFARFGAWQLAQLL